MEREPAARSIAYGGQHPPLEMGAAVAVEIVLRSYVHNRGGEGYMSTCVCMRAHVPLGLDGISCKARGLVIV
jgi:hypothetical protein